MHRLSASLTIATVFLCSVPSGLAAASGAAPARSAIPGPALVDFNGDGFADLAIGVRGESVGFISGAGAVNALYGSVRGLQARSPLNQLWTQDSPGVKDAAEAGDSFGSSMTTDDFNGDGFTDLAIGAVSEDVNAGAVNVLYGSFNGLQATSPDDEFWTQDSPGVKDSSEGNDGFGSSLTSGDFDGDGYDDLAIGVPHEHLGAVGFAGAVNVLYGSAAGLQAHSPDDQFWTQDSPGVEDAAESNDQFGYSLTSGDFNTDGFADLAAGVPFEDLVVNNNEGAANVLYGSPGGLQTIAPAEQFWSQDSPGVKDTAEAYDYFGYAMTSGDFNSDGFADLAVGVPQEGVGTNFPSAGGVSVLYGSAVGLQADSPDDQVWSQGSPGVPGTLEEADEFGWSLAAQDFNGDGFPDLAVGVPDESLASVSTREGAVNVLYGGPLGLQATSPAAQFWTQDSTGVQDEAEPLDDFGLAVGAGDWNGDGRADLAVGVPHEDVADNQTMFDEGAVNVLYGGPDGLQADSPDDQLWTQDSRGVRDSSESEDLFGWALA